MSKEEQYEHEWILVDKNIQGMVGEVVGEVQSLSQISREIYAVNISQSEELSNITSILEKINHKIEKLEEEIKENTDNKSSKIEYIKEYIIPAVSLISSSSFWCFGPKIGMIASTTSFLLYKLYKRK